MNPAKPTFSEEDLMVFADGQADAVLAEKIVAAMRIEPDLAERVRALQEPVLAMKNALDLAVLDTPNLPDFPPSKNVRYPKTAISMMVAASFALGMMAMNVIRPSPDWIDRVASYQALYVQETLAGNAQDPALTQAILLQTELDVGIEVRAIPELPGMVFKRVQMLAIDGEPLVQIAYLASDGTPFALCILRLGQKNHGIETTQTNRLAAASWIDDGVGYVLIGGSDMARVSNLATDLTGRI